MKMTVIVCPTPHTKAYSGAISNPEARYTPAIAAPNDEGKDWILNSLPSSFCRTTSSSISELERKAMTKRLFPQGLSRNTHTATAVWLLSLQNYVLSDYDRLFFLKRQGLWQFTVSGMNRRKLGTALTCDYSSSEWRQKSHDEYNCWNEATNFVFPQSSERNGRSNEVAKYRREQIPQEHLVPHFYNVENFERWEGKALDSASPALLEVGRAGEEKRSFLSHWSHFQKVFFFFYRKNKHHRKHAQDFKLGDEKHLHCCNFLSDNLLTLTPQCFTRIRDTKSISRKPPESTQCQKSGIRTNIPLNIKFELQNVLYAVWSLDMLTIIRDNVFWLMWRCWMKYGFFLRFWQRVGVGWNNTPQATLTSESIERVSWRKPDDVLKRIQVFSTEVSVPHSSSVKFRPQPYCK